MKATFKTSAIKWPGLTVSELKQTAGVVHTFLIILWTRVFQAVYLVWVLMCLSHRWLDRAWAAQFRKDMGTFLQTLWISLVCHLERKDRRKENIHRNPHSPLASVL